jgi:hypothetical protein
VILAAAALACLPHLSAGAGRYVRTQAPLHGPGLLLDGGGPDVGASWRWMQRTLVGDRRGGNVLVLTAEPDTAYDAWALKEAPFASVRTLYIPTCASRSAVDSTARIVAGADAVFFEGGDQAHYVRWKGTRLIAAIERVYARGGVVGGTSAGLAIQGAVVYDSVAADRVLPDNEDVRSRDATRDPYERAISFTTHLFAWPPLEDVITDTHFARRNRFGRLAAFMARIVHDRVLHGRIVYGLGVDQGSALVVNRHGIATLLETTHGKYRTRGAWVVRGGAAGRIAPGVPLLYTVWVTHLAAPGTRYDLKRKTGPGVRYRVTVDGARAQLYSRDPYGGERLAPANVRRLP